MKTECDQQKTTRRARGEGSLYLRGSTWWVCFYTDGRQQRESAKTSDEGAARKYLRKRLKEAAAHELAGMPFITQRMRRSTISELLDGLKADLEIREKWTPQASTVFERVRVAFGSRRAASITDDDVRDHVKKLLAEGYAKATINHGLQTLKQAYKLAELPAPKIRRLDVHNARTGFFSELEVRRVMSNLPPWLADFVLFGWLTGMRRGEIASLAWADVIGDEIRLRAENAKTGEGRVVPLEGELVELIERRRADRQVKLSDGTIMASPLVFHRQGKPVRQLRKIWQRACCGTGVGEMVCRKCSGPVDAQHKCSKCGVELKSEELIYRGRIFHDLRRSAARNMLTAGVPQAVAMQITGHKTDSMFRRYAIVTQTDVRKALRQTQEYTASELTKAVGIQARVVN
jgi:integrase